MPSIKLANGNTVDISLEEVVIRDANKKTLETIPLFPERAAESDNEFENYDPMTMEFKKVGIIKGNIMGLIDENSIQFDEKTNTISGNFSGMRKIVEENDIARFKQYDSKFSLNLETKKITEEVAKVESLQNVSTDLFKQRATIKPLSANTEEKKQQRPR